MSRASLWLRAETKPAERRTVITPTVAGKLVDEGYSVTVERSSQSAFESDAYAVEGCEIVDEATWHSAPDHTIIIGLKELPESTDPLHHRHVHFAHVFKEQAGWQSFLSRFAKGNGQLFDLEYLVDDDNRRVAAFGRWAGFAGAALAVLTLVGQRSGRNPVLNEVHPRNSEKELVADVLEGLRAVQGDSKVPPRALVIGALGRSGRGAVELFETVGLAVEKWDLAETQVGGPFCQILDFDIVINCVFVQSPIPPFLTPELLSSADRRLSVICDVSCDPYGDYNPLPLYDSCTTFAEPTIRMLNEPSPVDLIAIDHLPSLLPMESSEDFAQQLLPSLLQIDHLDRGVWKQALDVFHEKIMAVRSLSA